MNNSPLSSVLLPAVFVSSAVFSTLTIPFALIRSEPVTVELPFYSGEIQPIFDGQHNEVAMPYIGFSIVVSVGAGIATVEVNRRWQKSRKLAREKELLSTSQLLSGENEASPEAVKLPEYRPEADAAVAVIDFSDKDKVYSHQPLIQPSIPEALTPIRVQAMKPAFAPQETTSNSSTVTSTISEKPNLYTVTSENNGIDYWSALGLNKILESPQEYQTCRIKVPHLKQRLFAIEVNGEYYSFFRALETKDQVIEVMAKLGSSVQKTAITKNPKTYVIWAWEPEVEAKFS